MRHASVQFSTFRAPTNIHTLSLIHHHTKLLARKHTRAQTHLRVARGATCVHNGRQVIGVWRYKRVWCAASALLNRCERNQRERVTGGGSVGGAVHAHHNAHCGRAAGNVHSLDVTFITQKKVNKTTHHGKLTAIKGIPLPRAEQYTQLRTARPELQ